MFKLVDIMGRDYTIISPRNDHIVKGGTQTKLVLGLPTDVQKGWGMFDNQFLVL